MGSETRSIAFIQCAYERGLLNQLLLSKGVVFICNNRRENCTSDRLRPYALYRRLKKASANKLNNSSFIFYSCICQSQYNLYCLLTTIV
jgi:hypothetical protein